MKKTKKQSQATYVALYPWMLRLGITDVISIYVFGAVYNLNMAFDKMLRLEDKDDWEFGSNYLSLNIEEYQNALANLLNEELLAVEDNVYYYINFEEVKRRLQ